MGIARETGWSERYILEELPYARGVQYMHAILRANDIPCFYLSDRENDARAIFASLTATD
jgi:hypothetical protein